MKKLLSPLALVAFALALVFGALLAPHATANVLAVLGVLAVAVFLVASTARRSRRNALVFALNTLPTNQGTSRVSRRYKATAALATRYVFVKQGADDEHIAAIAATSDKPVGVIEDEAAAAEDGIDVLLPGATDKTVLVLAGAAIATLNVDLYLTSVGKVVIKPTAAGTYWKVGRNKTLAEAANDQVEVELCEPRKLIVLAALTNTAGDIADTNSTAVNPTKTDFDSLLVAAGKLQADFLLMAAALKDGADIDYATT